MADLKAADFRSAIPNMHDDGAAGGPLPYLGHQGFNSADKVPEDEDEQYVFCTAEELEEVVAGEQEEDEPPETSEGEPSFEEFVVRSRAQLATLREYVVNRRVLFVALHTGSVGPALDTGVLPGRVERRRAAPGAGGVGRHR